MDSGFAARGWSGPHPLLPVAEARTLGAIALACLPRVADPSSWGGVAPDFGERPWFKSLHAHVPAFHALAGHPGLVAAVTAVLGPDVIAWGVSAMRKRPGETHPWHTDIEHVAWRGVSIFLGLSGTVPGCSGLKFIGGSQHLDPDPDPGRPLTDGQALAAAQALSPDCSLDYPPVGDGEYILFDGPVWHASHNSGDRDRVALILQYCAPSERVRTPLRFNHPVVWHAEPPPCVLVAGEDRWGLNRLVTRPTISSQD